MAVNTKVIKDAIYSFQSHKTLYIMNWMRNSSIGRIFGIKEKSLEGEKFLYLSSRLVVTIKKTDSPKNKIKNNNEVTIHFSCTFLRW